MSTTPSSNKKQPRLETASIAAIKQTDTTDDSSDRFACLPLDIIELVLSFLDDEHLLKETNVLLSCKRMLQASEQLCEKVFQELVTSRHTVDDTFEQRLQQTIAPGRVAQLLPCRQRLCTAQRTPLRQGIVHTSGTTFPAKLVFSPSCKKFAVICGGRTRRVVSVMDTTTMRQLFTIGNSYSVLDMLWIGEDENSFVTRSRNHRILLWSKTESEEEAWTSTEMYSGERIREWTKRRSSNQIILLVRVDLGAGKSFHVCSLDLQSRTMTRLFFVNFGSLPIGYRIQMFCCGIKWLFIMIFKHDVSARSRSIQGDILIFNMETNEQVQFLGWEPWCRVKRHSESDHTFFIESCLGDDASSTTTRNVTMFRLDEESGLLSPVAGSSFPIAGARQFGGMMAVSESHIACTGTCNSVRNTLLYNAKTGKLERTIPSGHRAMAISSKRNELITLTRSEENGHEDEVTINAYCLGKLPRPI